MLKRLAIHVKSSASPLMQEESNTIRKRLAFFDIKQGLYKEEFKKKFFFKYDFDICDNILKMILLIS